MKPRDLDPVIHAPKRFAILATLRGGTVVEFQYLKSELELSDSDLSKQMTALINAGYVTSMKHQKGSDRSTWYRIAPKGRKAFDRHVASLEALIALSKQLDDVTNPEEATIESGGADG